MSKFYKGKFDPSGQKSIFQVKTDKENRREKKRMIKKANKSARKSKRNRHWWHRIGNHKKSNIPYYGHHTALKVTCSICILVLLGVSIYAVGSGIREHRDSPVDGSSYQTQKQVDMSHKNKAYSNKKKVNKKKNKHLTKADKTKINKIKKAKAKQRGIKAKLAKQKMEARKASNARSRVAQQKFNADFAKMKQEQGSGKKPNRKPAKNRLKSTKRQTVNNDRMRRTNNNIGNVANNT